MDLMSSILGGNSQRKAMEDQNMFIAGPSGVGLLDKAYSSDGGLSKMALDGNFYNSVANPYSANLPSYETDLKSLGVYDPAEGAGFGYKLKGLLENDSLMKNVTGLGNLGLAAYSYFGPNGQRDYMSTQIDALKQNIAHAKEEQDFRRNARTGWRNALTPKENA